MKIEIARSALVTILGQLSIVAKPRSPTPILCCALLETTENGIRGVATDLLQSVATSAPAVVKAPGGVAVSARDLLDRVKTLPDGTVTIERDGPWLRVASGKRKHKLQSFSPEEFPPIAAPRVEGLAMSGAALASLLRRTKPMASADPTRPQMHAVHLEFFEGKMSASATDGHRVALVEERVDGARAAPGKIVPIEAVEALLGLIDDGSDVTVGVIGQELAFALGPNLSFLTKVVADHQFPPVRSAVSEMLNKATVNRAALVDALHSVDKASDVAKYGSIRIDASAGLLKLKGTSRGEAEDEIDADYQGRELFFGMSTRYMLDALATMSSEEVVIGVVDCNDNAPVQLRPVDESSNIQLIMPQQLGGA